MVQKILNKKVREVALDVLHTVFHHVDDESPLPVLLERAVEKSGLQGRDGALLSELTYGVIRRYRVLDAMLHPFLNKPEKLSLWLCLVLRLGAYELAFLDIPARATVYELAGLARRRFGPRAGGLVNAVLRRLAEQRGKKREDGEPGTCAETQVVEVSGEESMEELAVRTSLPSWLVCMWLEQYGSGSARIFAENTLFRAAPCWRVNMLKPWGEMLLQYWIARHYAEVGSCGFSVHGLEPGRATAEKERILLESFEKQGCLSRQGAASQYLTEYLGAWIQEDSRFAGSELWDACCGRGGKTLALLEKGVHVALSSDPSSFRLEQLRAELCRLNIGCKPEIRCSSAQDIDGFFPMILLDAPCSGTGTLGRNAELRLRLSPERLAGAGQLQKELLESVWMKLQPGGVLFYVTCALNKQENEGQAEAFVRRHADAWLVEEQLFFPEFSGQDALFLAIIRKRI